MKTYSQNGEDQFVLAYFKGFKGTLLEIGANDGKTLSNSLLLIESGWFGHLVEPGHTFDSLKVLHANNPRVYAYNYAIASKFVDSMVFFESGAHVINGNDTGLVSTLDFEETERWRKTGVEFIERRVSVKPFAELYSDMNKPVVDFISIDAEGFDWDILQQINLADLGCMALCIEWNSIPALKAQFTDYCASYGLKLAHVNNENLIFIR